MLEWVITVIGVLLAGILIIDGIVRSRRTEQERSWWHFFAPRAGILWGISLLSFIASDVAGDAGWDPVGATLLVIAVVSLVAGVVIEWRTNRRTVR